jgi:hypothetical protein
MAREPAEIARIKEHYADKCLTLLIRRPGLDVPDNHADKGVDGFDYDFEVYNDGDLGGLARLAKMFKASIAQIHAAYESTASLKLRSRDMRFSAEVEEALKERCRAKPQGSIKEQRPTGKGRASVPLCGGTLTMCCVMAKGFLSAGKMPTSCTLSLAMSRRCGTSRNR